MKQPKQKAVGPKRVWLVQRICPPSSYYGPSVLVIASSIGEATERANEHFARQTDSEMKGSGVPSLSVAEHGYLAGQIIVPTYPPRG